ncbi:MAG: sulfite exporter TauE/SafE family protein [Gemmatimonadota bacterium]|jgi:hypothetical protein|nr:sulfite exporter TauE/SafE family protein [Gemmatimonadota bacterium]
MFRYLLFVLLSVLAAVYLSTWVKNVRGVEQARTEDGMRPSALHLLIGFVTNFFDTFGIGSFAPTTSWFKLQDVVPDEHVPGTMHVGHSPPVIVQAFIFIAIIEVDLLTLGALIGASVIGAWLGAGTVSQWPRRNIQLGMGIALVIAAVTFVAANLGFAPVGGASIGLTGVGLGIGIVGSVILGALMTLGIGMYAPSMIMISVLGMNPAVAFPIMMGSCAFLMPVAAMRFLPANSYSLRPAIGLALGGLPAVLIAALIVEAFPLTLMRWLVVIVVTYAAIMMLRSAYIERPGQRLSARSEEHAREHDLQ